MGQGTDVLVIGGGPAGLAAAIAARKKGFAVTIADGAKPPIDKPCGEGLTPNTLRALRELGVAVHAGDGHVLRGIRFLDEETSVAASFPGMAGIGMRRTVLHEKMVQRAKDCGVSLMWNTPVSGLAREGAVLGGDAMAAKWIIGADGMHSRVRRWSGLDQNSHRGIRFACRRHYRMQPWTDWVEIYWSRNMQAFVTPLGSDEICLALISRNPRIRVEEAWRAYPQLARRLKNAEVSSTERGAVTAMFEVDRIYKGNIALIGDASGTVDAITGEGLGLSFRQAVALADALEAGQLERYQAAHHSLAKRPRVMGRLLLLLDQFTSVRKRALRVLAKDPGLFARLLADHVGETSFMHFAGTGMRLGCQFLAA